SGSNPFKELADFSISLLILPHSNAEVERVFSQMNLVKNKLRNRMQAEMANAILAIRAGLKRHGKSCFNYEIPEDISAKIGTALTYAGNKRPMPSGPVPSTSQDTSGPSTSQGTVPSTSQDSSATISPIEDDFEDDLDFLLLMG
ncbi:unnamed protein product, partial [Meganyctiphanes norvegica]